MLEQIRLHVRRSESFAFETTLAGRYYGQWIPDWQAVGYSVQLIFLRLPTAEMAIERVANRVAQGGHAIPEDVIRRRFDAGWRNFNELYQSRVDMWQLYDNAGDEPILLEEGP